MLDLGRKDAHIAMRNYWIPKVMDGVVQKANFSFHDYPLIPPRLLRNFRIYIQTSVLSPENWIIYSVFLFLGLLVASDIFQLHWMLPLQDEYITRFWMPLKVNIQFGGFYMTRMPGQLKLGTKMFLSQLLMLFRSYWRRLIYLFTIFVQHLFQILLNL